MIPVRTHPVEVRQSFSAAVRSLHLVVMACDALSLDTSRVRVPNERDLIDWRRAAQMLAVAGAELRAVVRETADDLGISLSGVPMWPHVPHGDNPVEVRQFFQRVAQVARSLEESVKKVKS
jgi:hypothetical protein